MLVSMKNIATIAGVLLGLLFLAASSMFLLDMMPEEEPPPEGSATEHFFAALVPTGYMTFVKVCELIGAILVAIPRTRTIGLLILAPIVANIFAFHVFIGGGAQLSDPMVIGAGALTAVVLLCELPKILGLMSGAKSA